MRYTVYLTEQASEDLAALSSDDRAKAEEALDLLADGPEHPALESERCESVFGPNREEICQSLVMPGEPDGLRLWWWRGPDVNDLTILAVGPHRP